jgi:two-component system, NarL family, sensor histidine kinase UhpB
VLGDHGLLAAVERHLRDYGSYGITTRLESAGFDGARLPPETETALYRIIQEALTNVARHSGAARATVHLRREDGWVEAVVADDGRGFDAEALLRVPDPTRGLGLHSIQERTTVLGGAVDVRSTPGTGTTVRVRLPVPA